jgi:hypothetical protein
VHDLEKRLAAFEDVLSRLLSWAAHMGGWEAAVWDEARALLSRTPIEDPNKEEPPMTRKALLDRASTAIPSLTRYYNDQGEYVEGEGDILAEYVAKILINDDDPDPDLEDGGRIAPDIPHHPIHFGEYSTIQSLIRLSKEPEQ